jgi:hypothetical protein
VKRSKGKRGAEIMALRARARRPDVRPGRTGRANRKRQAIREATR